MKRYGYIYEDIYDIENLRKAFYMAKKDKSYYSEVIEMEENLEERLLELHHMLKDKTYTVSSEDYEMFTKNDKGKMREIFKLDFYPHRVVQWALMLQIEDIMIKDFVIDTYSSIPKRGIHLALDRLDYDLLNYPEETKYCLKMDIEKFYPSINQSIAKQQFRRKFKDNDLLWLIDMLIESLDIHKVKYNRPEPLSDPEDKAGIAIGSLFSQYGGNFYLSEFGHWLKEVKKVKFLYIYCDDIVILSDSKEELHQLRKDIQEYLWVNLRLKLKGNYQVFPVEVRGIDFVGYRHFRAHILLRESTAVNMKRKMTRLLSRCQRGIDMEYGEYCCINSYKGWMMWGNCHFLYLKYIQPLEVYAEEYYMVKIKNVDKKKKRIVR